MGKKKKKKGAVIKASLEKKNQMVLSNWIYYFLFAFACALYINTLNHDFAFDDSVVITGNKYTVQGFEGIKTLVSTDLFYGIYGNALDLEGGRWRPLTLVMFAIEYEFFGDNPFPYHLINVLLYGISAIVIFKMLSLWLSRIKFSGRRVGQELALVCTLLFVAHPLHTEVVANIKSRDEIVSLLLLCLSLIYLHSYVMKKITGTLVWSLALYFGALLSKESGITFLAVYPLMLFFFLGKTLKQSLITCIPYIVTAVIYLAIRTSLVGMVGDRESNDLTDNPFLLNNFPELPTEAPWLDKVSTVFWILLKYLWLQIFPHPLTSDYGFNQIPLLTITNVKTLFALLVYGGLVWFGLKVLWGKIRSSGDEAERTSGLYECLSFSIIFFLATISIVSNLFFLIGTTMGERFAYISSLGFCLALASILLYYFKWDMSMLTNPLKNLFKIAPLLIILGLYSFKTIDRNPDWKNNEALFTADVRTSDGSANAHYYYANTVFTSHMNDDPSPARDSIFVEAKSEFFRGLQINPYFHYCYYNIGLIWEKLGNADSAIYYHQLVINLKPENTMAQYMAKGALGLVYGKLKGDPDKAIPLLKEALLNKPDDNGYHENLGICYAMKGDFDASIREFETSLATKKQLKKEDGRILMNLALSYDNKGDTLKAQSYRKQAFQLDPTLQAN